MQGKWQHLVPILVSDNHLLYNLLDILVRRLHSTIHFWTIWGRVMMFYLDTVTQLFHHFIVEIRAVISNDLLRNPITTNDIMLDKTCDHLSSDTSIRCCLNPFGKVINSNKDELMSIRSGRLNFSNHINAPHCKRPWRSQNIQRRRWHMHLIDVDLTFVTVSGMVVAVILHGGPIILRSQDLLGHGVPTRMRPERTFMNFFYNLICFVFIHASEQNRVIVPFVQHTPIEEKFSRVLAQSLLINDGSIFRVFFRLEIPFDVVEPRFFIRLTFDFIAERRLIQPHYSDRRGIICPSNFKHG